MSLHDPTAKNGWATRGDRLFVVKNKGTLKLTLLNDEGQSPFALLDKPDSGTQIPSFSSGTRRHVHSISFDLPIMMEPTWRIHLVVARPNRKKRMGHPPLLVDSKDSIEQYLKHTSYLPLLIKRAFGITREATEKTCREHAISTAAHSADACGEITLRWSLMGFAVALL